MAAGAEPTTSLAARRWGAGTSAIVRELVAARGPISGAAIARLTGVTQPRASQVLKTLSKLDAVDARPEGYVGRRARLLDLYATRSRPVLAGSEGFWYSPRPVAEQTRTVVDAATAEGSRIVVSADFAPDLLVPWRHLSAVIVYASTNLELSSHRFVPAEGRADATLIVRWTSDPTLLRVSGDWPAEVDGVPLADPVQQWRDLLELGGADREEGAARLRRAILHRSFRRDR